jgi:hypothetical protein
MSTKARIGDIELRRRRIDAAFARADALAAADDGLQIQADYARHCCVLVSGFLEKAIAELILHYAQGKTPRPLQAFLESSLRRVMNIDTERLLNIMGSLDAGWRNELDMLLSDEQRVAVNSVVGLRNDIAHGGGTSLSLGQVRQYWRLVQEVVQEVERILLTTPQRRLRAAR